MGTKIIAYTNLGGFIVCCLAHSCGLYLLYTIKRGLGNQRLIIMNLAGQNTLFGMLHLAMQIDHLKGGHISNTAFILFCRIYMATTFIGIMLYIVIDRMLDIHLHMRYNVFFPKRRVIMILALMWSLSGILTTVAIILAMYVYSTKIVERFCFYAFLAADLTFVVVAITAYGYMYVKLRKSVRNMNRLSRRFSSNSRQRRSSVSLPRYLMPCALIASYMAFMVTGSLIGAIQPHLPKSRADSLQHIRHIVFVLGILSNALIYIFLQKRVRKTLRHRWRKRKSTQYHSSTTRHQEQSPIPGTPVQNSSRVLDASYETINNDDSRKYAPSSFGQLLTIPTTLLRRNSRYEPNEVKSEELVNNSDCDSETHQ